MEANSIINKIHFPFGLYHVINLNHMFYMFNCQLKTETSIKKHRKHTSSRP